MGGASSLDQLTQQRGRALFNGQAEYGRTEDVIVYSDGTPEGDATAQALLRTVEADFQATQAWFGGLALPAGQEGDDQTTPRTALPVQVLIDPQAGGAYHFGCDATDIYVEPDPELVSGFFVAELVEDFEAAIANGWDCGQTNGEGLSRVLAGERNANLGSLFVQTEQSWWANGHQDYVEDNSADDTNQDANGCATLFLYYLHSQLGYDWAAIVAAGAPTLGQTYQKLTGQDPAAGFADFVALLSTLDMGGFLNVPASGDPFPIAAPAAPAQPQPDVPQGEPIPAYSPPAPFDSAPPDAGIGYGADGDMEMPDLAASVAAGAIAGDLLADGPDVGAYDDALAGSASDASDSPSAASAASAAPQTYEVYETQEEIIFPAYAPMPDAPAPPDQPATPPDDGWNPDLYDTAPRPALRTEAPATETPVTVAPATEAPATETPVTVAPVTVAPVREAPQEDTLQRIAPQEQSSHASIASVKARPEPFAVDRVDKPATTSVATTARQGVETMIGVVVVLIILVLLALITVLFYGGLVSI
jgi:hypothetical protein